MTDAGGGAPEGVSDNRVDDESPHRTSADIVSKVSPDLQSVVRHSISRTSCETFTTKQRSSRICASDFRSRHQPVLGGGGRWDIQPETTATNPNHTTLHPTHPRISQKPNLALQPSPTHHHPPSPRVPSNQGQWRRTKRRYVSIELISLFLPNLPRT